MASFGSATPGVIVHDARQQILVETSPVHSDAYRLVVLAGNLDHLCKLLVTLPAMADVAGIDAVFGQCPSTFGMVSQQAMTVVMKVSDQRHIDPHAVEMRADLRHRSRRFRRIDRDPHQFGTGTREFGALDGGFDDINGIGIGHRLDDDGRIATHTHLANPDNTGRTTHCVSIVHCVLAG